MQSADASTSSPLCKRQRHNSRDASGELVSKHIMSPEFICRYIDWRKSRLAMLPSTRKRDRGWYASLPWNQWFLDGIVKNEMVPSMRTLAHIYDSAKPESPITGCALHANTHAPLQRQQLESIKTKIVLWCLALLANIFPQALQLRNRRPTRPWRQSRRPTGDFSVPSTGPMQARSQMRPPQSPPYWQRALSRAPPRRRRWLSLLSSGGKRRRRASCTHRVPAQARGTAGALSLSILLTPN